MKFVFFLGKPTSGKDTQADFLVKRNKFKKIVTSHELENFFNNYKRKYFFIKNIKINIIKQKKLKDKGNLVSYILVGWLVDKLLKDCFRKKISIVFAGSPRSLYEAKICLKNVQNFSNINSKFRYFFIYLRISNKEVIRRIKKRSILEKRTDDKIEVVKNRLRVFNKEVMPAILYLKNNKVLYEISGEGKPEEVYNRVFKILKNEF
jgi:adenylate kinase